MTVNEFANKKNLNSKEQEQLERDLEILAEIIAAYLCNTLTRADEND